MRYFVDLTGTVGNREAQLVELIDKSRPDFSPASATVCTVDGKLQTDEAGGATVRTFSAELSAAQVEHGLLDTLTRTFSELPPDESMTVGSFSPAVRHHTVSSPLAGEGRLHFLDLRTVLHNENGAPAGPPSWQESFMPSSEAVKYLVRAVANTGGSQLKTNLRGELKKLDPKFDKDGTGSFSNAQKFISILVTLGQERGFVRVQGPEPNPTIVLTDRGRALAKPFAPTVPAEPQLTGGAPADGTSRESDSYLSVLRSNGFGPFQEVREAVYDEMDNLLQELPSITVRDLLGGAVERVRKAVEEARQTGQNHLLHDPSRGYPWSRVRSFLCVLLTRCHVLVSNGATIGATWTELKRPVDSMEPNWRTKLDSEFIVFLLEKGCTINVHTTEDLAGAIYNTRRPAGTEKVEDCISHLISESHRCVVTGAESRLTLKDGG